MLNKGLVFFISLVIFMPSVQASQRCSAFYAKWSDWTIRRYSNLSDLQFGQSNGFGGPGLPPLLGRSIRKDFMGKSGNISTDGVEYYYYFSYHFTQPIIEYQNKWGSSDTLFYMVDYAYVSYVDNQNIDISPGSGFGLVSSSCPIDDDDDDDDYDGDGDDDDDDDYDDDDDDCCGLACIPELISLFSSQAADDGYDHSWLIPYLPSCDEEECPDLNLTIRGTLLPARRGTARISGDWCKSLGCGRGILK